MAFTKTGVIDKAQALALIDNFFEQFQNSCNRPEAPKTTDFEKVLSKNFRIFSNGKPMAKGLEDYVVRVASIKKRYPHVDITGPLEEPLLAGNKATILYDLEIKKPSGEKAHIYMMAMVTFEDNKIAEWVQVNHERNDKDQNRWDA